jgi:hypothetical protein
MGATGQQMEFDGMATNNQFLTQPGQWALSLNADQNNQMAGSSLNSEFWILAVGDLGSSSPPPPPAAGGSPPNQGIPGSATTPQQPVVPAPGSQSVLSVYPWAIVSDSTGSQLFVLARDAALFAQQYDSIVMQKIQDMGLAAKPVKIDQGAQCVYPMINN